MRASLRSDRSGISGMAAAVITAVSVIVICMSAYILLGDDKGEDGRSAAFGLSTTSITIEEGEIVTVTPISYIYLDSVEYSVYDDGVVSISTSGGYCDVTGMTPGKTSITAVCEGRTASCEIEVVEPTDHFIMAPELRVYDMNSPDLDLAILDANGFFGSGGFRTGELALSFNAAGYAVVSLAGYTKDTLTIDPGFIGNYLTDFYRIAFSVTGPDGQHVADSTYSRNVADSLPVMRPWRTASDIFGSSSNDSCAEVGFPIASLGYGEYSISVDLIHKIPSGTHVAKTITGTFEYMEGDGTMDSNEYFVRPYAWKDGSGIHGFEIEFPYYEYLMYYSENTAKMTTYISGGTTYYMNKDPEAEKEYVQNICVGGTLCDLLSEKLESAYGGSDLGTPEYAQFILTFVQICYGYGADNILYYGGDGAYSSNTDYWAYPAETVWAGNGDCEDTSILCAMLLKNAGFGAGVYFVPGHAIAAVALTDYDTSKALDISHLGTSEYGIMEMQTGPVTYYGCETTTERSRAIGVIETSVDVNGTVYDYCDTSADWCKLYVI